MLSGAKSDAGDAAVIAEYLRLRAHKLQVAAPYSDETQALRTLVRTRDDVVDMRVAATNQLSALLDAHWPGAKAIFADVESPISPEFLTRYPTPAAAARLGEKRMAAFLIKHGYSGRRAAAELLARLRSAPAGATGEALTEALRDAVLAAAGVLTALNAAVKTSTAPSPPTSGSTRTARSSRRCQGRVRSAPPRCSPSGAMRAQPTSTPTPSPP
ncbi:MAG TPA: transposase [Streptosporangiaceae bacterium]